MPWPAVPLNSGAVFKTYFQVSGKAYVSLVIRSRGFFRLLKIFHRYSLSHQMEEFYQVMAIMIFYVRESTY